MLRADKRGDTEDRLRDTLREVFPRIDLGSNTITFTWDRRALIDALMGRVKEKGQDSSEDADCLETLVLPIAMKRRGVEFRMVVTNGDASNRRPDPSLVQLIAKAHCYLANLTDGSGRSLTDVARRYQTELSEVSRILPLAFLAPSITEAMLTSRQPASLTTQRAAPHVRSTADVGRADRPRRLRRALFRHRNVQSMRCLTHRGRRMDSGVLFH